MKTQHQNPNICQTCIYASECVHYQKSQIASKPIWFCANFDTTAALQVVENQEIYSEQRSSQSSKPGTEAIAGRRKGLCINCDNRASCLFPIVEGGVWHCEEYC